MEVGENEYLWEDLVGCEVRVADEDRLLGSVVGLQNYGAQDILCVQCEDGEWMLPFIDDVVLTVDIKAGRIDIRLLPGMDACFTPKS